MKIRIISDIHSEFGFWKDYLNELETDKESILILAGDIVTLNTTKNLKRYLEYFSKQFKYIFYIPGNHEYYHGDFKWRDSIHQFISKINGVYTNKLILEREKLAIIGKTLWTNFRNNNPLEKEIYKNGLNDCRLIENFNPDIAYEAHKKEVEYIFNYSQYYSERGFEVIVVTHHLPSFQSIDEKYKNSSLNSGFASDLDKRILESNIKIWIHGHTHSAKDYMIGNTRIICNPFGYEGEISNYNDNLVVEI